MYGPSLRSVGQGIFKLLIRNTFSLINQCDHFYLALYITTICVHEHCPNLLQLCQYCVSPPLPLVSHTENGNHSSFSSLYVYKHHPPSKDNPSPHPQVICPGGEKQTVNTNTSHSSCQRAQHSCYPATSLKIDMKWLFLGYIDTECK